MISNLLEQGSSFLILYYGGHFVLGDGMEIGAIITFSYLWSRLSGASRTTARRGICAKRHCFLAPLE